MTYEDRVEIEREVKMIHFIENYISELEQQSKTPSKSLSRHLISMKRKLRQRYKEIEERRTQCPEMLYSKNGDRLWTKQWFSEPFDEDDKQDYIDSHWIRINSAYDCTGLLFTKWIEIFNVDSVNGKAVVYHFMGYDF